MYANRVSMRILYRRVLYRTLWGTAGDSASGLEEGDCVGASFKTQISKSFSPLNTQRWILHRNQEQNRFELIVKLEKVWHLCVSHSAIIIPSDTESCHLGQPSESLLRMGSDSATVIKSGLFGTMWYYWKQPGRIPLGLGAEHRPVPAR